MPENKIQKRQVAYKVRINDLLRGKYVKGEGEWVPNYIEVGNMAVSRVNLLAVAVSKNDEESYPSIIIDDGSGKIPVRSFDENNNSMRNVEVGDIVLLIGRPREYGNERYIVPEIIKKDINPAWVRVRELEIKKTIGVSENIKDDLDEFQVASDDISEEIDDVTKIFELIKKIDSGDGVDMQEIIKKSEMTEAEKIIENLLRNGEVFEIKPGRIKVLE